MRGSHSHLYVLITCVIACCLGKVDHSCIHNEFQADIQVHTIHQEYDHSKRATSTSPIRIVTVLDPLDGDNFTCYNAGDTIAIGSPTSQSTLCSSTTTSNCYYTCTIQDVLTPQKRSYLEKTILPQATSWLSSSLQVVPVIGNLSIPQASGCSNGMNVGAIYRPISDGGEGGIEADLIILVRSRPLLTSTVAYAMYCQVDTVGRPTVGIINYSPRSLSVSPDDLISQIGVSIHELTHVLGFSQGKFADFRDPENNYAKIQLENILQTGVRLFGKSAKNVTWMVTPSVKNYVRSIFGCGSLVGAEIEDGGGAGTAGSHWEKRTFQNEFMTGSSSSNPILSPLTLLALKDSGWYDINLGHTSDLLWGRGLGCAFVDGSCSKWSEEEGGCSSVAEKGCTYDHSAKGYCDLQMMSDDLPPQYEYFKNGDLGGSDLMADYCPFYVGWSNGECAYSQNMPANNYLEEVYGSSSRCAVTSILPSDSRSTIKGDYTTGCFEMRCISPSVVKVRIGRYWYDCDSAGRLLESVGPDYRGTLTCPNAKTICFASDNVTSDWPRIDSIDPTSGPVGQHVTITGSNLMKITSGEIGGYQLDDIATSDTKVTATISAKRSDNEMQDKSKCPVTVFDASGRSYTLASGFNMGGSTREFVSFVKEYYVYLIIAIAGFAIVITGIVIVLKVHKKKKSKARARSVKSPTSVRAAKPDDGKPKDPASSKDDLSPSSITSPKKEIPHPKAPINLAALRSASMKSLNRTKSAVFREKINREESESLFQKK